MPTAPPAANSGGVHFLSPRTARHLARSCPVGPGDLVLDLGAGQGAVTACVAGTGARILAIERDARFVERLRRRFEGHRNVRVLHADLRAFSLPRKEFTVIAAIPYALSAFLFRRLLGSERTRLRKAAMIVEWGFARRVTAAIPRNIETAWWAARFDLRLRSRVPARCFSPPPRVDSALLVIERRDLDRATERTLWTVMEAAYRTPTLAAKVVVRAALAGRNPHPGLRAAGIDPNGAAGIVPPSAWVALARSIR